jgi:hypothetical protein
MEKAVSRPSCALNDLLRCKRLHMHGEVEEDQGRAGGPVVKRTSSAGGSISYRGPTARSSLAQEGSRYGNTLPP